MHGVPTIVMGDVNDCLSNQVNTKLTNVMSSHGFTQLVQSPTTDSGTLIDHVYYNGTLNGVIVEVSDIYYSDHDAVFVSIPTIDIPKCMASVDSTIIKPIIEDSTINKPVVIVLSVTVPTITKQMCSSNLVDKNVMKVTLVHLQHKLHHGLSFVFTKLVNNGKDTFLSSW